MTGRRLATRRGRFLLTALGGNRDRSPVRKARLAVDDHRISGSDAGDDLEVLSVVQTDLHLAPLRLPPVGDEDGSDVAFSHESGRRDHDDVVVLVGVDLHLDGSAHGDVDHSGEAQARLAVAVPSSTAAGLETTVRAASSAPAGAPTRRAWNPAGCVMRPRAGSPPRPRADGDRRRAARDRSRPPRPDRRGCGSASRRHRRRRP
jgi:hypothetical protein